MRRIAHRIVHIALLAVLAAPLGVAQPAHAAEPSASRVVIVLAPYLRWSDVDPEIMPTVARLADEGALGNINLRSRSRIAGPPSSLRGALTFSAGSWAAAEPNAPQPYSVDEHYERGAALDAYARMTGLDASDSEIVFLGLPRTVRLNEGSATLAVRLGALGQTVLDEGGVTAAIGNSDSGYEVRGVRHNRPAAAVAMDEAGRVALGDVSSRLLENDPDAPFGFSTDLQAFSEEYARVDAEARRRGGPALVVLDPGDAQRAFEVAEDVMPDVAEAHRRHALTTLDAVVALALDDLPEDGTLMVLPQIIAGERGARAGLGPALIYGPGWSGYLSSSSTQRAGLVTNLDVAATVLNEFGIDRPVEILGNPAVSDGSGLSATERIAELSAANATAIAVDSAKPPVVNTFIALTTLVLAVCTVVLLRARRWPRRTVGVVAAVGRRLMLLALAVPPASLLMFLVDRRPATQAEVYVAFFVTLGALWILALALDRFGPMRAPVAALSLIAAVALSVDQFAGAPLSYTGFLSYSPLPGARYYGMGNEGAALLFGSAAIGLAFVLDGIERPELRRKVGLWGIPIVGLIVAWIGTDPQLGANIAVAIWAIVGFAAMWAIYNKVRVDWRVVGVSVLVMVVMIAGFSIVDLRSDPGEQSHLARAWESMEKGGASELWLIAVRKIETNIRVLTHTNWSFLLLAVLAFLGFMRWRPQGDFAATLTENPGYSAGMAACLIGGVAAYVTEDSGIVIPALIMIYVGVGILHLMLARLPTVVGEAEEVTCER